MKLEEMYKREHVMCPDCNYPTYPPYYDVIRDEYFDGHYCENCAYTWQWNKKFRRFDAT